MENAHTPAVRRGRDGVSDRLSQRLGMDVRCDRFPRQAQYCSSAPGGCRRYQRVVVSTSPSRWLS